MAKLITASKKELNALVKDTKKSADKIFKAVESGQNALSKVEDKMLRQKLEESFNKVIENCYFQDFCGQRVSKVNDYLDQLEKEGASGNVKAKKGYAKLLNGPAAGKKGSVSQADIDKLF